MISQILALLIALFNVAVTDAQVAPTSYTYASRDNGAGYVRIMYGTDAILATTSPDGQYVITLCSATSCRGTDRVNTQNAPFMAAAKSVGCVVQSSGYFKCNRLTLTKSGTQFEDGSVAP